MVLAPLMKAVRLRTLCACETLSTACWQCGKASMPLAPGKMQAACTAGKLPHEWLTELHDLRDALAARS